MKEYTFRQILEHAPQDAASELNPLFDRLSEQVRLTQSLSGNIKDAIEVNLHVIQSSLPAVHPAERLILRQDRKITTILTTTLQVVQFKKSGGR